MLSVLACVVLTYVLGATILLVGAAIAVTTGFVPGEHIDLGEWIGWLFDHRRWEHWAAVAFIAALVWWGSKHAWIARRPARAEPAGFRRARLIVRFAREAHRVVVAPFIGFALLCGIVLTLETARRGVAALTRLQLRGYTEFLGWFTVISYWQFWALLGTSSVLVWWASRRWAIVRRSTGREVRPGRRHSLLP